MTITKSQKKGFVYSNKDSLATQKITSINPAWYYNWNFAETLGMNSTGIPFIPMSWSQNTCTNKVIMNGFNTTDSTQCILGFNEPDNAQQSNMSVQQALALWPILVATGRRIGSPATAGNATTPGSWFDQFMSSIPAPKVDFICIHWYAAPNPASLLNIIDTLYSKYKLPIWITEFAVADWNNPNKYTQAQVMAFMEAIIPELEKRSYVEKYCWKTRTLADPNMGSSSIFNDDGTLTQLGQLYNSF